mgnify:CR=1 FL=1
MLSFLPGPLKGCILLILIILNTLFWMPILVIGAILSGLSGSLFSGNNSALLYDTLKENRKEDKYAEFEGKNSSMFQFALGISAILGSFVLGFGTFQYLFWLSLKKPAYKSKAEGAYTPVNCLLTRAGFNKGPNKLKKVFIPSSFRIGPTNLIAG